MLKVEGSGITYTLLLRIEAIGFPTFGLVLYEGSFGVFRETTSQRISEFLRGLPMCMQSTV